MTTASPRTSSAPSALERGALGFYVGTLLTAALLGWFFAGTAIAGLPFPPFDLFDWLARVLPGAMIAAGTHAIVTVLTALGMSVAQTSKAAEGVMALMLFLVGGAAAGVVVFLAREGAGRRWGKVAGGASGVAAVAIGAYLGHMTVVGAAWLVGSFFVWGWQLEAAQAALEVAEADPLAPERRAFLVRMTAAALGLFVAGGAVGALFGRRAATTAVEGATWSATHPLPNADAAVQPAPGTRAELTPVDRHYRIDINTRPVPVDEATWRLKISGLVSAPLELSLAQLRSDYEPLDQFVTLACISNQIAGDLISTTRWTGASLQDVVDRWGLQPEATHLKIRSADQFYEVVSLDLVRSDPRVMLAYAWDGLPLAEEHGFPLRIYIPDRYGMKQPKWIESVEAVAAWEPGYWVTRGWDKDALMQATSVIDTVSSDMMAVDAKPGTLVPIGGIAHAGARGISKVEVRVDEGPWAPAALRTPLSDTTWVIWRYDWPLVTGDHEFTVRCVDGAGTPQAEQRAAVRPSGATGYHSVKAMF